MDYKKIGEFIANERKEKKLTQAKLAEKLNVSEKTVSKWENGNGLPDTDILPVLCKELGITVNELLSGEKIAENECAKKADEKLLEYQKIKQVSDKILLRMETVIIVLSIVFLLASAAVVKIFPMEEWIGVVIVLTTLVIILIPLLFSMKIEQIAGYYLCKKCGNKHVPTYSQVACSMHIGRTRYMKCPNCNKKSWQKKVIK